MKQFLIIITFLFFNESHDSKCIKFRNGDFLIKSEYSHSTWLITRNNSLQIEIEKETGHVYEWKVDWINDCAYSLKLKNDNFGFLQKYLPDTPTHIFTIIKVEKDRYIYQTTVPVSNSYDNYETIIDTAKLLH